MSLSVPVSMGGRCQARSWQRLEVGSVECVLACPHPQCGWPSKVLLLETLGPGVLPTQAEADTLGPAVGLQGP